ncbi:MAG: xanthine dehydrogenase family protein subunit M [Deltaproteobacteria bacterium]|nr:xanthine dehydrogenase family protein subunit M [Deltaproteobacteria bacterium]
MKSFAHVNALSVDHALSVLEKYGQEACVIAGGQDLLFRIKKYLVKPSCVVNLKTIPGLSYVRFEPAQGLKIGALTTLSRIAGSAELCKRYSGLAQAARSVASPQTRNLGTIGGNLCQDVWCWYLQAGFSCWKSGGKFCDLAGGDSRYYGSIMKGHLCLANSPSDTAPALAALDAQIHIASPRGTRKVPILEFLPGHQWVGNRLQCHILQPDEVLTEIEIPLQPTRSVYLKFALRKSWNFALASVAASATIEDGICQDARVVLGGIATHPYRSPEAESVLVGRKIDERLAQDAAEIALEKARPLKMNGYKVGLSKTLIRRALLSVAGEDDN